jgi:hypothetical protein
MTAPLAFPHSRLGSDADGMTLRDYFAAKALQALLTTEYTVATGLYEGWTDSLAYEAYHIADAMIKRRGAAGLHESASGA